MMFSFSKARVSFFCIFISVTDLFPDVAGNLEGESIVGESIPDTPLFLYRMRPQLSQHEAFEEVQDREMLMRKLRGYR